jgi:hypothetical protein
VRRTRCANLEDPTVTPVPGREADARILELLRTHDAREGAVLAAYQRLVDESTDEGIRYLGRMILDDEERHHQVLGQMAERVDAWMHGSGDAGTPSLTPRVDSELLDETRRLIALERADAKELRHLQTELRYAPATSLLPLLVKLMLHDNAKHIEILKFIRTYAG